MKKKDDLIFDDNYEIELPEERTICPKTVTVVKKSRDTSGSGKKTETKTEKTKKSTKTIHTPVICNYLIQGVNEVSDNQYLAVSYTGGVAVSVAKAKINQEAAEQSANIRFQEHLDTERLDQDLFSAKFAFVQSIINVAFNSFLFGFLVCLLSNLFQVFLRRKDDMKYPTFKQLFKKSIICGLISMGFGVIITAVMLPISIFASELFYEESALIYVRLITIGAAFFIAFVVSVICFSFQISSFRLGLLQAVKVLPRFFIYIVCVSLLQMILPDLAVVAVAVIARILMAYLTELKDKEKTGFAQKK